MKFSETILILLSSIVCLTCNSAPKKERTDLDSQISSKKIKNHSKVSGIAVVSRDSAGITKLPFGSKILTTYKFPKNWQPADNSDENPVLNKNDEYLNKLSDYYSKARKIKSINGPEITSKVYIKLGNDSLLVKDQRQFKNDFKYRLSNIDKYELYYVYDEYNYDPKNYNPIIASKHDEIYMEVGSLIFYDPKTKTANILNVYYSIGYPEIEYHSDRFFYFGSNKTIKIFESNGDESGNSFETTQEISVLTGSKIIVKNLN